MNTETRKYKDVEGNPVTLDWLVKNEPEWAASQIRHRDRLESELAAMRCTLEAIAEYDEKPIWDDCRCKAATEILNMAKVAVGGEL